MKKPTTISKESVSEYREFVQLRLRKRVLEAIEVVLEEEVNQALGCGSYERAEDRRGYRNGAETRRVTTSVGTRELRVLRARVRDEGTGETTEFRSELLPLRLLFIHPPAPWVGSQPCGAKYPGFCADSKGV